MQNLRPPNVKVIFKRPSCDYKHTGIPVVWGLCTGSAAVGHAVQLEQQDALLLQTESAMRACLEWTRH